MTRNFIHAYFFIAGLTVTNGYMSGAPENEAICQSLTPGHPADPQETVSPYTISVDKTVVRPGQYVTLTISSESDTFKGFLVQGRKINQEDHASPFGNFVTSTDGNTKGLKCEGNAESSITHTNNKQKSKVSVHWIAPQEKATYVLLTTVVKDGATFWVRQPSENINVV